MASIPQMQRAILVRHPHRHVPRSSSDAAPPAKATEEVKAEAIIAAAVPVPRLSSEDDDFILVRTTAVALEPHDWKVVAWSGGDERMEGCRVGCSFAGVVVGVGGGEHSKVMRRFQVGERVMGIVHGTNPHQKEEGAFQEYLIAQTGLCIPIPSNLTNEEAAVPHVALVTCGIAMYRGVFPTPVGSNLPFPSSVRLGIREGRLEKTHLLIYGGSSATGTLAIQYAKLSGLTVLTTCSPHNFALVRSYGADHVFDYTASSAVEAIRTASNNSLSLIFDCIGAKAFCFACFGNEGSEWTYVAIAPSQVGEGEVQAGMQDGVREEAVKVRNVKGQLCFEDQIVEEGKGGKVEGADQDEETEEAGVTPYAFISAFYALNEQLLSEGKLRVHPVDARDGNLKAVLTGLAELKGGKVSGRKIVVRM